LKNTTGVRLQRVGIGRQEPTGFGQGRFARNFANR